MADRDPLSTEDVALVNRITAGLAALHRDGQPTPDPRDPAVLHRLAMAVLAEDAARATREQLDDDAWADLAVTPARGPRRHRTILRLAGKLLSHGLDPRLTGALLHSHNRARCAPPLPAVEVDRLLDWTCHRHADALESRT